MTALMMIAALLVLLGLGWLYALSGRGGHPGLAPLRGWKYAHRGLHKEGLPENSLGAFRAALEKGYGIELDLHLMKDGNLAVIHDSSLLRTAGVDVNIEDLTAAELEHYRLEGTGEKIPTFDQVLSLFDGKAPMIVELKTAGDNYTALADAAVQALEGYHGLWCMESFDPRCIYALRKRHPQVIRGQLAENFLRNKQNPAPFWLKFSLTYQLLNFLTKPDFTAYNFPHRKNLSMKLARALWGIQGVAWTLRSREEFDEAVKEGYLPIFEGFEP